MSQCPRLDPRLGLRALVAALVHLVVTRGHASCSSDRIALAAILKLVAMHADLQNMASSLADAVELLERAEAQRAAQTTRLSEPEKRKANSWN